MGNIDAPLGSGRSKPQTSRTGALVSESLAMIQKWMDAHPRHRLSWSGGKDSTLALWFARQINPNIPVCWFDSGLEFPQTRAFIERVTEKWDLNLHVYPAQPDALTVMEKSGQWDREAVIVPGDMMMDALIEKPSAAANTEHGAAVIYGLRADESRGRRALLSSGRGIVQRHVNGVLTEEYVAPVWRWTTNEVIAYSAAHKVPMNPLYRQMEVLNIPHKWRRVGTIVTGSMLDQGRWMYTRMLAPDLCRQVEARLPLLAEFR